MAETEQEQALNKWLEGRPDVIVDMAAKLKPWLRYRVKQTGQHCSLCSYSENGTVTVTVDGHDNSKLSGPRLAAPFECRVIRRITTE